MLDDEKMMDDEKMTTVDSVDDNEHAWGVPVRDLNLTNLSDNEYLNIILGPRRMGYQVTEWAFIHSSIHLFILSFFCLLLSYMTKCCYMKLDIHKVV